MLTANVFSCLCTVGLARGKYQQIIWQIVEVESHMCFCMFKYAAFLIHARTNKANKSF